MPNQLAAVAIAMALLAACVPAPDVASESAAPRLPAGDDELIDGRIERRMNEAGIVGLGAAIIVNRRLVWAKGYGLADLENAVPFTPTTIMNVGSISKTFTGAALMHAVQEGHLSLDEDINAYLPFRVVNPFYPDERITLRHLATHTSGITDREPIYEETYHYGGDSPEPLGAFLEDYFVAGGARYSPDNFLEARPGAYREYSNIAAGLAGHIVELAVGEQLNAYTRRHIFAPLQMDDTGWFLSEIAIAKHSTLYDRQGDSSTPVELYGLTTYPDGGVRTSVADLAKFFIALLNGGEYEHVRILEKPTVEEMLRFQYTDSSKPDNVNLSEKNSGIFWSTKYDVTRIGHGGSDPGVMTDMLADLTREIGVILFVNTSLSGQDGRQYVGIFDDLWNHAVALKEAEQESPR